MKKQLTIKSKKGLAMVTKLVKAKIDGAMSMYTGYTVELDEWLKGSINHINIKGDAHMITLPVLETLMKTVKEYREKYEVTSFCATLQAGQYLCHDAWLSEPIFEITISICTIK
jgi:hypothetical protein